MHTWRILVNVTHDCMKTDHIIQQTNKIALICREPLVKLLMYRYVHGYLEDIHPKYALPIDKQYKVSPDHLAPKCPYNLYVTDQQLFHLNIFLAAITSTAIYDLQQITQHFLCKCMQYITVTSTNLGLHNRHLCHYGWNFISNGI